MFDSVLIVSFGGLQGRDDIRPFLANVLRGRRVSPERVEEVAHHYELFGGVSPITSITRRQAEGLRLRLEAAGHSLHLANRVAIGHAELMARWPDVNLAVHYQSMTDFQLHGVPDECWV